MNNVWSHADILAAFLMYADAMFEMKADIVEEKRKKWRQNGEWQIKPPELTDRKWDG